MAKTRQEVSKSDCWNVEDLYSNFSDWEKELSLNVSHEQPPFWPQLDRYKGKLNESAELLKEALEEVHTIDRQLAKLYTYAHLKHDEDITHNENKVAYNKVIAILHQFAQETAWFEPELLAVPDEQIQKYLQSPILEDYHFHLEKIFRQKKHMLSPDQEELMAQAGQALQTSYKTFSAINDADFKFGSIEGPDGENLEITHGLYGIYIRHQNRDLREKAFKVYHKKYEEYANTLCELLNGQVQVHQFNAKARNYNSCLEAALFPKNIDVSVYHSLIQAVNEEISALHEYMDLRKKVLNLDSLHLYDVYVPLTPQLDLQMNYEEAVNAVIESVKPLGEQYQQILAKGMKEDRWVDRYENQNKRSGAYSSGCYDSMPYILMNYKNIIRDVFTLAHEAGHSMHSYYSHQNQPYQYGHYPIFLAEVASTFNEDLLTRYLLKKAQSKEEKIFLINQKIEDIRTTLFRQTMFAEFELFIHEQVEKRNPLTPQLLKEKYRQLNQKYFGPAVVIDQEGDIEWARIPHFYYNFYVYQYATGISAALALAEKVVSGGKKDQEEYLNFLRAGSSKYPIEILQLAGVDMRSAAPVKAAIQKFKSLIQELNQLISS